MPMNSNPVKQPPILNEIPHIAEGIIKPHHVVATQSRIIEDDDAEPSMLVVRGMEGLAPFISLWQELADSACEPNVFYEPWMVLPALKAFPDENPEFYLIFSSGHGPNSADPQLSGLFPIQRRQRYKGFRTGVMTMWKYLYCCLCTPLIRKGHEANTINTLLEYCASEPKGAAILEWSYVSADGPFAYALCDVFYERGTTTFVDESWTRAAMKPNANSSPEEYLKNAISRKARKEYKRKDKRLSEQGRVEYVAIEAGKPHEEIDLNTQLNNFLEIEAAGWKGKEGSAFACDPAHRTFFLEVTKAAYEHKCLSLTELRFDGQAIASKCDLISGGCGFAFKIAYDENFSRFSPGLLLELEGINEIHHNPNVTWMDSCAVRDHFMINRIWSERRMLQNIVIATGQGRGEFVVASLPMLRHLKRVMNGLKKNKSKENKNIQ
jgi:hypothetical protein